MNKLLALVLGIIVPSMFFLTACNKTSEPTAEPTPAPASEPAAATDSGAAVNVEGTVEVK